MAGDFSPMLAPVDEPKLGPPRNIGLLFIKSLLAERHKYFLTAAVQLAISTLFPGRYAVVPIATLTLTMLTTHLIDRLTPSQNPPPAHMLSVVPGRATALLPHADGTWGSTPSSHPLVVFNLGVQFNHPRGQMCPYAKELAEKFAHMSRDLLSRREELGLLSVTNWTGLDLQPASGAGPDTLLMSYYFRDVESIHRFAHEEMHREAWDWYNSVKPHHIGIFHETFVVPAHGHESIYVNCRPFMLGASLVKVDDEKKTDGRTDGGEDHEASKSRDDGAARWRNLLVSADHVVLNRQWQRLNRDANGVPREGTV
ncbi:hypothetical protein E4U22_007826 [Claviceps purpurea]|nr:hypothetical protein E4U27_002575 [Claviceps purpurea]KAG6197021.1 hypothetical protein E4U10_000435 [Claviceps purpurea]KAG6203087.1 hypothetical protein E4U50_005914 [Claviceps purpurea]KAG6254729.1 hypothetical protein E4U23_005724 [Claviceps purpurea]KAG6257738.1 hypothetical protein E4U24_004086 [Claviceps purpurea]